MHRICKNSKNGFTLVELLAVIGVLSLILIIAVPKINDYVLERKKNTFIINARNIARQLEYDNMDLKVFDKIKLSELEISDKFSEDIDLDNSIAYVKDDEIYVNLVGKNQYNNLFVCGVGVSNKNIEVQDTSCNTIDE